MPPVAADASFAIRSVGLGKCYRQYDRPSDRLLEGIQRALPGKRFIAPRSRDFWALRNVDFAIAAGETVGIIGRNGSGKSTLLQMIAGTLAASEGSVSIHGRVAALLELGAGFHPEFSGIENVYLNAGILGLSRDETDARLDDILAFADIGDFAQQPVRTYSSGMYVRLAFSVAINVDPEILIVDEALSVGDMAFQAKCMDRLRQFQERGGTLLFVSHDISAVKNLCRRAIYLEGGRLLEIGDAPGIVDRYTRDTHAQLAQRPQLPAETCDDTTPCRPTPAGLSTAIRAFERDLSSPRHGTGEARVRLVEFLDNDGKALDMADFDQESRVRITVEAIEACTISVNYKIRDRYLVAVAGADFLIADNELLTLSAGDWHQIEYRTRLPLMPGDYSLRISVTTPIDRHQHADFIDVIEIVHPFKVLPAARGWIFTQVYLPNTVRVEKLMGLA